MVIQHNMVAANASRQLGINTTNKSKSTERLSSGYRINRAADDAAGFAISEKMRWSIRGLHQASRNIEDGASLVQTADGAMGEIHAILQRQRELSVQAANDTNTEVDRDAIQREMNALSVEITRIANDTTFNTKHILNCGAESLEDTSTNEDSAVTMRLGNPSSNSSGILLGFMATNQTGTVQSQLLYGGIAARTSFVEATVTDGTRWYGLQTLSATGRSDCTVANENFSNGAKTTFTYNYTDMSTWIATPIFSIIRTVEKVDNPTGTGEVYKLSYQLQNHTNQTLTGNIEMSLDVMFIADDNPSFLMDDNEEGTDITHSIKYADADMPSVMNLYSTKNPNLNIQAIVQGYGTTTPDYVKIGTQGFIVGTSWVEGMLITDSAYGVGWENISIAAGSTSAPYTTMYGVSDPSLNPALARKESHSESLELNIQASDRAHTAIKIPLVDCRAERLGVAALNVTSYDDAGASLNKIDKAIDKVSEYRASMGAIYNRLEKAKNNVDNEEENVQSAESRIRDTDMAEEMVDYSKHSILEQAGISVLAQAGKINEGVLQLLQ